MIMLGTSRMTCDFQPSSLLASARSLSQLPREPQQQAAAHAAALQVSLRWQRWEPCQPSLAFRSQAAPRDPAGAPVPRTPVSLGFLETLLALLQLAGCPQTATD